MKKTLRLFRFVGRLLPVVLVLALCLAQAASAASTRLSGDASLDGIVQSFKVASTGDYAV